MGSASAGFRLGAVDPVLLHQTGGDLGKNLVAEEGEEMDTQLPRVSRDIHRIPLGGDQYHVFGQEMLGRFAEGLSRLEQASPRFASWA